MPSLADVAPPPGAREVRMSTGHGMIYGIEYVVVRIVQGNRGTLGEVWRYRGISSGRLIARRVVPMPAVDWTRMLARLDSLGADTLRVPLDGAAIMDAGELLLESRLGSRYRSVSINAPTLRTGEAARRATIIAAQIDSLDRVTSAR